MIRAAINALAYSAGFALGRVERHRRSVARIAAPTAVQVAERQAMRAQVIDDLCTDWAREIEFSAEDVLAEWEASS